MLGWHTVSRIGRSSAALLPICATLLVAQPRAAGADCDKQWLEWGMANVVISDVLKRPKDTISKTQALVRLRIVSSVGATVLEKKVAVNAKPYFHGEHEIPIHCRGDVCKGLNRLDVVHEEMRAVVRFVADCPDTGYMQDVAADIVAIPVNGKSRFLYSVVPKPKTGAKP